MSIVSQSLSCVWLFATPWTAAHQASLSITNSWSLLKLMSIESVMPSNYLILCCSLLPPSVFPSIRVFSSELAGPPLWFSPRDSQCRPSLALPGWGRKSTCRPNSGWHPTSSFTRPLGIRRENQEAAIPLWVFYLTSAEQEYKSTHQQCTSFWVY